MPDRSRRARCPMCLHDIAVRRGGELPEHRDDTGDPCPASGMTVDEAERATLRGPGPPPATRACS